MRLAVSLDYASDPLPQVEAVAALEAAGLDHVWVPEAYGFDAVTVLGALAMRTSRVTLGPGVLPVHTRTPALIAQTAAGLDALSGGRAELGLGTSGPGVVTGFHGVPFTRPLARVREVVATCRAVWRREAPQPDGLRPILAAPRARIPITLATLRPAAVALTAELAEGWFPLLCVPERIDTLWGDPLRQGRARRDAACGPLQTWVGVHVGVGGHADAARAAARQHLALYVGGMGPRGGNFYTELAGRLGWPDAAQRIQHRYLAGDRVGAARAVPDEMLDALTLTGAATAVAARLREFAAAGVTGVVVRGPSAEDPRQMELLKSLCPA